MMPKAVAELLELAKQHLLLSCEKCLYRPRTDEWGVNGLVYPNCSCGWKAAIKAVESFYRRPAPIEEEGIPVDRGGA